MMCLTIDRSGITTQYPYPTNFMMEATLRALQVFVDGPYGNTGNERTGIFSPKHAIIILVGPKVEPLASVLQSILIRFVVQRHSATDH